MMKLIRTITALLIAAGIIGAAPLLAQAQSAPTTQSAVTTAPGKVAGAATTEVTAKVVAVDPAQRTVTLLGASGKTRTIEVGDQVRNFDQIKVGDTVHAQYTQALALELKKGPTSMAAPTEVQSITPAPPPGAKPGGTVARKVTAVAEVIAVDPAKQMVTLRGPKGNEVDVEVQDPNQLKNIKTGDHVQVTYVEALAIRVAAAPSAK
jgi:Cu/Ag efflux protein CusF